METLRFIVSASAKAPASSVAIVSNSAVLSLAFLVVGIALFGFWYRGWTRAKRAMTWPKVPGTIIESAVVGDKSFDGGDEKAHILYSYAVNGISLQSKSVGASGFSSPAGVVKRYPIGTEVQVFYDPQNPRSALLERTGSGSVIILFLSVVNLTIFLATLLVGFIDGR